MAGQIFISRPGGWRAASAANSGKPSFTIECFIALSWLHPANISVAGMSSELAGLPSGVNFAAPGERYMRNERQAASEVASAAPPRDGGAMNSGPIGSFTVCSTICSIRRFASSSSFHPIASLTGSSWAG